MMMTMMMIMDDRVVNQNLGSFIRLTIAFSPVELVSHRLLVYDACPKNQAPW
jgi:hypothetical protein